METAPGTHWIGHWNKYSVYTVPHYLDL